MDSWLNFKGVTPKVSAPAAMGPGQARQQPQQLPGHTFGSNRETILKSLIYCFSGGGKAEKKEKKEKKNKFSPIGFRPPKTKPESR